MVQQGWKVGLWVLALALSVIAPKDIRAALKMVKDRKKNVTA